MEEGFREIPEKDAECISNVSYFIAHLDGLKYHLEKLGFVIGDLPSPSREVGIVGFTFNTLKAQGYFRFTYEAPARAVMGAVGLQGEKEHLELRWFLDNRRLVD